MTRYYVDDREVSRLKFDEILRNDLSLIMGAYTVETQREFVLCECKLGKTVGVYKHKFRTED